MSSLLTDSKIEYTCNGCSKLNLEVCSGLKECERVNKSAVVCSCGTRVYYPANTPHPRFCKYCAEKEIRKHAAQHRKLDSF